MAAKASSVIMPIVSKVYCSPSQVILVVRRRPHVVHGGGFVVTNCTQKVVFRVDGCGILGKDGEVVVRDAEGDSLLLIRRKVHFFFLLGERYIFFSTLATFLGA